MASCQGKKSQNVVCGKTLYKCNACGNIGCDQAANTSCPNQGFSSGRCAKCGKSAERPA